MSGHEPDFFNTTPQQIPQDRVRICAYYEGGELTNMDVSLNYEDVTNEDIEKLVALLRVRRNTAWRCPDDLFPIEPGA